MGQRKWRSWLPVYRATDSVCADTQGGPASLGLETLTLQSEALERARGYSLLERDQESRKLDQISPLIGHSIVCGQTQGGAKVVLQLFVWEVI